MNNSSTHGMVHSVVCSSGCFRHRVIAVIPDKCRIRVTVAVNPHRTDPVAGPDPVRRSAGTQQNGKYQNAGDSENPILHFPIPELRLCCEYNPEYRHC